MAHASRFAPDQCIRRHGGRQSVHRFSRPDQFLEMAFRATHPPREPARHRGVRFRNPQAGKTYSFLTNEFTLPALTVAQLYKSRRHAELFFKWIKQHL
jgi:IS4 transposase